MLVYVVDDEINIARSLAAIIRLRGWEATFFTDPRMALQCIALDAPDVLITDVIMPQMDGVELAMAVEDIAPTCHIILLSGQAMTTDLLGKARLRGRSYSILQKPIHPDLILERLQARKGVVAIQRKS